MKYIWKVALATALIGFTSYQTPAQTETLQHYCGTEVPDAQWENEFQKLILQVEQQKSTNRTQATVYTIPVIIHVIHGGQAVGTYPNLAQAQLNSQITVLNNDFAGVGYNNSNYPYTAFSAWAANQINISPFSLDPNGRVKIANCEIQFCLATMDTLGNVLPEPGIDRINYISRGWTNPGTISNYTNFKNYVDGTIKPQTIWNVTRYLNIWITDVDMANVNLLGYATFPPLTGLSGIPMNSTGTSTTDGFWCYSRAFGSVGIYPTGTYYTGYTRGRTSTHEIGHWLGLRHIWGDGNCANDYCDDTPSASASNFGSPNYPFKTINCSGNSPNGEMFMNFMDYTNDNSKYMFTYGQAQRAQTAMATSPYRMYLGTHGLCTVSTTSVTAAFNNSALICTGVGAQLLNTSSGFPPATYTWSSSGGVFIPNTSLASPTISFSQPGTYVVTLAADNGTLSIYSKTITVTSPAMPVIVNPASTICAGNSATLVATGLSTYTWEPGTIMSYQRIESPQQTQTYTCTGTAFNGCTNTTTVELSVSQCVGIETLTSGHGAFAIYPNPASEWLHISTGATKAMDVMVEVSDALGKLVMSRQISFGKDRPEQELNIASLQSGAYVIKLRSEGAQQFMKFVKE